MVCAAIAVVVSIAVVVGNVVMAVRMATELLHLPRRDIAISPTFFLALVPSSRTLVITIVITITVVVAIGVTVVIAVFVFVLVLFVVVTAVAVAVATLGVSAGRQGHAEDQRQQKLHESRSHCGTLLPAQSANHMPLWEVFKLLRGIGAKLLGFSCLHT